MKRLATILILLTLAAPAMGQSNPIVGSNHWTTHDPPWGGFQLRHVSRDALGSKVSANNIVNGDGLAVIRAQHEQAKSVGAFTVHRTIYNYHRVNHANATGLTFKEVRHWDGSLGWVVDYDNPGNLVIIEDIEQQVAQTAGHLIDAVQLGFGLLNENNFGRDPPPVSIDGMYQYFLVMRRVWGDKLQICIGGSYGTPDNAAFTRQILTRIADAGYRFLSEFQDSYGQEIWDTQYHAAYEIWENRGIEPPIISWREVTGGCNQWLTHPAVRATPAELYAEFVDRQYSFLHNMGCWPIYPNTDQFIADVMAYLPGQVAAYRDAIGAEPPPPPPPTPDPEPLPDLETRVSLLEAQMQALQNWIDAGNIVEEP